MTAPRFALVVNPQPDPDVIQELRSNLAAHNVGRMGDENGDLAGGVVVSLCWGMADE